MVKEELNKIIYKYQKPVLRAMRFLSISFALVSLVLFFYYYGYPVTPERKEFLINGVKFIFLFFVLNYLIKLLFTFNKTAFIKKHWFETIVVFLLIYDGISYFFLGVPLLENFFIGLGVENYFPIYVLFVQFYLLLFVGMEVAQLGQLFSMAKLPPHTVLMLSYAFLISMGTFLLMMPNMTTQPGNMPFIDALFTATSASCVTGLIVVDTATYFTFKGQLVIMALIQIGGIGILVFGMLFVMSAGQGLGIRGASALQRFFDASSLYTAKSLLWQVLVFTMIIEIIGAILIYIFTDPEMMFDNRGGKMFFSVFHSISAFCNAGFSTLTGGLENPLVNESYLLHIVIGGLIFFGALGFHAIRDLTSKTRLRQRMKNPWRPWEINTRVAVFSAILLSVFGAVVFFILQWDQFPVERSLFERIVTSFFQSITARTAGFSTVDIGLLQIPVVLIIIFLMFVGGSSASTAGGIRTSTFVLLFISAIATIRGKKQVEIGHRQISTDTLNRAFSIFLFALSFIFAATFLLTITDGEKPVLHIVFEAVSAFCTTGLSMGITGEMSGPGKGILIICMYSGRLGILTLAFTLSTRVKSKAYSYPKAHVMVG